MSRTISADTYCRMVNDATGKVTDKYGEPLNMFEAKNHVDNLLTMLEVRVESDFVPTPIDGLSSNVVTLNPIRVTGITTEDIAQAWNKTFFVDTHPPSSLSQLMHSKTNVETAKSCMYFREMIEYLGLPALSPSFYDSQLEPKEDTDE